MPQENNIEMILFYFCTMCEVQNENNFQNVVWRQTPWSLCNNTSSVSATDTITSRSRPTKIPQSIMFSNV